MNIAMTMTGQYRHDNTTRFGPKEVFISVSVTGSMNGIETVIDWPKVQIAHEGRHWRELCVAGELRQCLD